MLIMSTLLYAAQVMSGCSSALNLHIFINYLSVTSELCVCVDMFHIIFTNNAGVVAFSMELNYANADFSLKFESMSLNAI